jgi:hypothetical protein
MDQLSFMVAVATLVFLLASIGLSFLEDRSSYWRGVLQACDMATGLGGFLILVLWVISFFVDTP